MRVPEKWSINDRQWIAMDKSQSLSEPRQREIKSLITQCFSMKDGSERRVKEIEFSKILG